MDGPKKNQLSASGAVAAARESAYTRRGEGAGRTMTGADERFLALDRKLTDGLNLLHGELAEVRQEIRESRREARAQREADRKEASAQREADRQEASAQREADRKEASSQREADRQEAREERTRLEGLIREGDARLEGLIREGDGRLEGLIRESDERLEAQIRDLTVTVNRIAEQSSAALERSAGFAWTRRQIAVRVAVGIALLAAGSLLGPLGQRLLAALGG